MTDFGRRAGTGDMLKAVYDPNDDGVIAFAQTQADMIKAVYDPNDDGVIAVAQTQADMIKAVYDPLVAALQALAAAHKTQHQTGGTDEINCTGLVGRLNYVDIGDPANPHFTVANFTTDGNDQTLDLSSVVPAGTVLVHLILKYKDGATETWIIFTQNGNSNDNNRVSCRTLVANHIHYEEGLCPCDANRVIRYKAKNTAFDTLDLTIKGYYI